ncbi:LPS assembly lipoprotein LptE [Thermodesulfobacterium thermophilum]|uniref:LPS assembly lipoprotein LptE n=1 Tax=Thermodesulfobacterium thermophilum TaxID=886 RepID=UPI0003B4FBEF|nr:LptE family protein [Thermodesulfobacterium thermophilum]
MWFLSLRNLLILWFSFILLGCGYSFYQRPLYLKEDWKTIYIPPWKNYSSETSLGEYLSYYLRHKFAQGQFLLPVYDEDRADLVLKGEIKRVYLDPISYETFLVTKERKISFEGEYQLIERKTGKVILKRPISRYEVYRVAQQQVVNFLDPGREEALKLLSQDLAEIILQDIMFNELKL